MRWVQTNDHHFGFQTHFSDLSDQYILASTNVPCNSTPICTSVSKGKKKEKRNEKEERRKKEEEQAAKEEEAEVEKEEERRRGGEKVSAYLGRRNAAAKR